MTERKDQKLYTNWWFWVILGFVFIFTISVLFVSDGYDETKEELKICREELIEWDEWLVEYNEMFDEYCELDPTNILC